MDWKQTLAASMIKQRILSFTLAFALSLSYAPLKAQSLDGLILPRDNETQIDPIPLPSESETNPFHSFQDPIETDEEDQTPPQGDDEAQEDEPKAPSEKAQPIELPAISYDFNSLPQPVRRMRELILKTTKSGDIEQLRALIGIGNEMTLLSLGGFEGDPIDFLKEQSGDSEGHELLAILEEIMEAGFVRMDEGTEHEVFIWPYFFAYPVDQLTPQQRVELFRIVTYGDYQEMEDFGGYIFYRVGISPTGQWQFFVAGD